MVTKSGVCGNCPGARKSIKMIRYSLRGNLSNILRKYLTTQLIFFGNFSPLINKRYHNSLQLKAVWKWKEREGLPGNDVTHIFLPRIAVHTHCASSQAASLTWPSASERSLWPENRCARRGRTPPRCHTQTLVVPARTQLVVGGWQKLQAGKKASSSRQTGYKTG